MKLRDSRLSVIHPFYNDKPRLEYHIKNWESYPEAVQSAIDIVLVDDGSEEPLVKWTDFNRVAIKNIQILRVVKDLKWNTPGALNLGVIQAPTDWVIFMDSDCMIDRENMEKLLDFEPEPDKGYQFPRNRITDREVLKVKDGQTLGCTILIRKDLFLHLGGFDEDFTGEHNGGYGFFDNDFTNRMKHEGHQGDPFLHGVVINEYMEDIVGPNVQTRMKVRYSKHLKVNKILWYDKINKIKPRSREHLRFEWVKDFERREV